METICFKMDESHVGLGLTIIFLKGLGSWFKKVSMYHSLYHSSILETRKFASEKTSQMGRPGRRLCLLYHRGGIRMQCTLGYLSGNKTFPLA